MGKFLLVVMGVVMGVVYIIIYRSAEVEVKGKVYQLLPNMLTIKHYQKTVHGKFYMHIFN